MESNTALANVPRLSRPLSTIQSLIMQGGLFTSSGRIIDPKLVFSSGISGNRVDYHVADFGAIAEGRSSRLRLRQIGRTGSGMSCF